jgi:hypothetical protein
VISGRRRTVAVDLTRGILVFAAARARLRISGESRVRKCQDLYLLNGSCQNGWCCLLI